MEAKDGYEDIGAIGTSEFESILKAVVESRCFGRSERQLNLFKYLLRKTISGESHRVKQYAIALDVFDRPSSFDQQTDSIVRVEMHRLRRNLATFNAQSKTLQISLPKGQFTVAISDVKPAQSNTPPNSKKFIKYSWVSAAILTAIACLFFIAPRVLKGSGGSDVVACSEFLPNISIQVQGKPSAEMERTLKYVASQYTNFNVVATDCRGGATPALQLHFADGAPEILPTLFVTKFGETDPIVFHRVRLTSEAEGKIRYDEEIPRGLALLLKPYGSLSNAMLLENWNSASAKEQYRCLVAMHTGYGTEIESDYLSVHECLESAVNSGPTAFDIQGGLAASYLEQYLGNYGEERDAIAKSKAILDSHEDDWIESVELSLAKMMFEANRPDYSVDRFRGVISRVAGRYASNPQVLLTAAGYMGFWIGDWESAHTWSVAAKNIHADRDHSVFLVDAAYVFVNSGGVSQPSICRKAYSENSSLANIIVNACAKESENQSLVQLTEDNLYALKLGSPSARISYIRDRNFELGITEKLIELNQKSLIK